MVVFGSLDGRIIFCKEILQTILCVLSIHFPRDSFLTCFNIEHFFHVYVVTELIMSSSCTSKTTDYYYQMRQKNNEAARNSRFKKKVAEIEISAQKRKLEVTYVQLKKEIKRIQIVKAS